MDFDQSDWLQREAQYFQEEMGQGLEDQVDALKDALKKNSESDSEIQKRLDDIVSKGSDPRYGILFITVGKNVQTLIDKEFKPHDMFPKAPTAICFSMDEGRKLQEKGIKWTSKCSNHNPKIVDKVEDDIKQFIQSRKPFAFYRNGMFVGVNDVERAVAVVCHELGFRHYMLVVGDPRGLDKYLEKDVQIVAAIADLKDNELRNLNSSLKQNNNYGQFYSDRAVFTLLMTPTVEEVKNRLLLIKDCAGISLTIIYSGHGEKGSGDWVLDGGDVFSGTDLLEVLEEEGPQHYLEIRIYLNCCYGFAYAKDIGCLNFWISCLDVLLHGKELCTHLKPFIETDTIKAMYKSPLKYGIKLATGDVPFDDSLYDKWLELNNKITSTIFEIRKSTGYRGGWIDKLKYKVTVVPFSAGPLDAIGILPDLYNIRYTTQLQWLRSKSPLAPRGDYLESSPDPQLLVFPASYGDSTLFRWKNFNMLVDGGPKDDPPCFWETVRHLPEGQHLNIVVVTHYDEDHIVGILRLFENPDQPLPIPIDSLYTIFYESRNEHGLRSESQGKDLYKKAKNRTGNEFQLKNLVSTKPGIVIKPFFDKDGLRIFMLTPTTENFKKVATKIRGLSDPNKASASLLIECQKPRGYTYILLTGDAPGDDIIEGLHDAVKHDQTLESNLWQPQEKCYKFDYIDMPHHGSKENNPSVFLNSITTEICVVSTDGKKYDHPDDETLDVLKEALEKDKIKKLIFTYQELRPIAKQENKLNWKKDWNDDKHRNLLNYFPVALRCRCHFGANNPTDRTSKNEIKVTFTESKVLVNF